MKKLLKILSVILITVLFIVGCSSGDDTSKEPNGDNQNQVEEDNDNENDNTEDEDTDEDVDREIKSKALYNLMNADTYTMEMRNTMSFDGNEVVTTVLNVVSGDKVYSKSESGGMTMEYIEKGDKFYLMMNETKTVMVSNRYEDEAGEASDPGIVYDDLNYVGKGKEEFMGENMSYEEYDVEIGTAKYFIENGKLKGMKMTIDTSELIDDEEDGDIIQDGEAEMIIEVLSYEEKADESLFEIPEDYEVLGE